MGRRDVFYLLNGIELELVSDECDQDDNGASASNELICLNVECFTGKLIIRQGAARREAIFKPNPKRDVRKPPLGPKTTIGSGDQRAPLSPKGVVDTISSFNTDSSAGTPFGRALDAKNEHPKNEHLQIEPNERSEPMPTETPTLTSSVLPSNGTSNLTSSLMLPLSIRQDSTIPDYIREARAQERSPRSLPAPASNCKMDAPPTKLHSLCADASVSLSQLETALSEDPTSASVLDSLGRTPLHIIGNNDSLFFERQGRLLVKKFVLQLIQAYPDAITTLDYTGRMPFIHLIEDWWTWVYDKHERQRKQKEKELWDGRLGTPHRVFDMVAGQFQSRDGMSGLLQGSPGLLQGGSPEETAVSTHTTTMEFSMKASKMYPRVVLWEEVAFCFEMLSLFMDELGGQSGGLHNKTGELGSVQTNDKDKIARTELATHIVTVVPGLLRTVLLIESGGGDVRKRLLKMSIFRRLILCPEGIGPWLTNMLCKRGIPAKRAVDFLVIVSEATAKDYFGDFRTIVEEDLLEFDKVGDQVFEAMEHLEGIISSLVVLEERDTERAASCAVVWHIMNRNLIRPFVVSLMTIDFVLHITLLMAVRSSAGLAETDSLGAALGNVPNKVAMSICSHYIIRRVLESISLFNLSVSVFRAHVTNMWTILDFVTIASTVVYLLWNESHPTEYRSGFDACVVGLLWLKVLGFLKVTNRHMATFIMAITRILRDLKYFAIVLLVVIFMVGDMMSIITITSDDDICETNGNSTNPDPAVADFCSPNRIDSYLRTYAILLGDFDLNSFMYSRGMTIIFFLFTIGGIIILLNVLIAVTSDSYEGAKISGNSLFARARVTFVAQNQALETFLRPGSIPLVGINRRSNSRKVCLRGVSVARWLVLLSLISTTLTAEVFLVDRVVTAGTSSESWFYFFLSAFLAATLTAAIGVLALFALEGFVAQVAPRMVVRAFALCKKASDYFVNTAVRCFFDVKSSKFSPSASDEERENDDEWNGRMNYMEHTMERLLVGTKKEILSEIQLLETKLEEKRFEGNDTSWAQQ